MLSPLDRGQSGRLLCEEGAKELVKRSVCSFPSPPNHLFLSDRPGLFCKKMLFLYSCMVWAQSWAWPERCWEEYAPQSAWTTCEPEVSTWWGAAVWRCSRPGSLLVAMILRLHTAQHSDLGMATHLKTKHMTEQCRRIQPGREGGAYGFRKTRSDCLFTAQEWTAT